ncbi:MAG: hypothetical protein DLM73_01345 [Chthoniobacterales bacterium]|nr:MAG: hypothetical protein DLM73_01345 [Chthoniobacterales bacterium]
MQIYIARDGKQLGPFSLEEINRQLAAGTLTLTDNAWYEGAAGWAALSTIPGVSAAAASASPTLPASITPSAAPAAAAGPVVPAAAIPAARTEPLAIWSLVLSLVGLLGFCCGGPILGIAAVICGHLGLSKIAANPTLQGRGLALTGLIIGYFAIVSWVIYLIFFGGLAALQGILESSHK